MRRDEADCRHHAFPLPTGHRHECHLLSVASTSELKYSKAVKARLISPYERTYAAEGAADVIMPV